ncbi:hypothetical protein [Miltoncostaea marina]|uniref:hypothetical protein n=1 Tax=Miltoncostaea marina TaxID=2843215 RepID=UPI001C3D9874|nr:hypothetical protein [Miltoncostaea marina]
MDELIPVPIRDLGHRTDGNGALWPTPSDLTDDEWWLVCDLPEHAPGRRGGVRLPSRAARSPTRSSTSPAPGSPWRYLPSEYPAWGRVWQQFRR